MLEVLLLDTEIANAIASSPNGEELLRQIEIDSEDKYSIQLLGMLGQFTQLPFPEHVLRLVTTLTDADREFAKNLYMDRAVARLTASMVDEA